MSASCRCTWRERVYIPIIAALAAALVVVSVFMIIYANAKQCDPCVCPPQASDSYYTIKCKSYSTQNTNLSKGHIVFIGDSITDMYLLDDYYSDLPLATYNRGIGGDTSEGVLNRLQVSVFDLQPSKIVLMIGVNDIFGGVSNDTIFNIYQQILAEIKSKLPSAQVNCMSVISQNGVVNSGLSEAVVRTIPQTMELNTRLKTLVESYGYRYHDLFTALADDENRLKASYTTDGIHLNGAGYAIWTELIKPFLQ